MDRNWQTNCSAVSLPPLAGQERCFIISSQYHNILRVLIGLGFLFVLGFGDFFVLNRREIHSSFSLLLIAKLQVFSLACFAFSFVIFCNHKLLI